MIQTVEAVINQRGTVRLLKRIRLPVAHRGLVRSWKKALHPIPREQLLSRN